MYVVGIYLVKVYDYHDKICMDNVANRIPLTYNKINNYVCRFVYLYTNANHHAFL